MALTPVEIRQFAEELAHRQDEVALRASVSRSYYAAFHASDFLARQGGIAPSPNPRHRSRHERLIGGIEAHGKTLGAEGWVVLAKQLWNLKALREQADYKLGDDIQPINAEFAVEQVARIFDLVHRLGS